MWWLVALGLVGFGLLVLVLAGLSLLSRLSALGRATSRAQARLKDAQTVQMSVAHLQERLASVAEQAAAVQQRLDKRGAQPPTVRKG